MRQQGAACDGPRLSVNRRLAVGREQQDGAVVDDDLDGDLVVLDVNPDEPVSAWQVRAR